MFRDPSRFHRWTTWENLPQAFREGGHVSTVDRRVAHPAPLARPLSSLRVVETLRFRPLQRFWFHQHALALVMLSCAAPLQNHRFEPRIPGRAAGQGRVAARQEFEAIEIGTAQAQRTPGFLERDHASAQKFVSALRALRIGADEKHEQLAGLRRGRGIIGRSHAISRSHPDTAHGNIRCVKSLPDFLKPLEKLTRPFPSAAVVRAIERREESTPHLLRTLERVQQAPQEVAGDYMLHLYALHLLAQFRETRAYRPIVGLSRYPQIESLFGDTITESLGGVIASVCDGDEQPIRELIEDANADEFARGAGITALAARVLAGQAPREKLSHYFSELFASRLEREPSYVWDALVCACVDLRMKEQLEAIRQAYREGFADPFVQPLAEAGKEIASAPVAPGGSYAENYALIDDTIAEMSGWCCFEPRSADAANEFGEELEDKDKLLHGPSPVHVPAIPLRRPEPRVGRNEPCACGSGRKYKKCCGGK